MRSVVSIENCHLHEPERERVRAREGEKAPKSASCMEKKGSDAVDGPSDHPPDVASPVVVS